MIGCPCSALDVGGWLRLVSPKSLSKLVLRDRSNVENSIRSSVGDNGASASKFAKPCNRGRMRWTSWSTRLWTWAVIAERWSELFV